MGNQGRWSLRIEKRVRKAVKDSGLSKLQVAKLSGIPNSTLDRRLRGIDPWDVGQLERVANALEIDPNELIGTVCECAGEAS